MSKFLNVIIVLMVFSSAVYGLTTEQTNKIKMASKIGKTIKARDGMTFETALPSIMGQESSWGVFVIGDKWDKNGKLKSVYLSSLGNFQIKLSTAKLTIKKYPKLYKKYKHLVYNGESVYLKYEYHKNEYERFKLMLSQGYDGYVDHKADTIRKSDNYKKMQYYTDIINNPKWIERVAAKKARAIRTMKWAKKELNYHEILHLRVLKKMELQTLIEYSEDKVNYSYHLRELKILEAKATKDMRLINRLLTDFEFGAEIGGHYLLSMYESAIRKGFKNPYKRAIGRYNGGWNNTEYYTKVMSKSETVKKVVRKA